MNFEATNYTKKELQLQLTNGIVHLHDLTCRCDTPLQHIIDIIATREPTLQFQPETKKKIEKWLTTTDHGTTETTTAADDILEDGDLDALFAADFDEENG